MSQLPLLPITAIPPRRLTARGWPPAARRTARGRPARDVCSECVPVRGDVRRCVHAADDDRDIDLYHWSSTRFSAVWRDTLSVLVARGRAQVSVAAAVADWPKRIRDMRYVDHEDYDGTD